MNYLWLGGISVMYLNSYLNTDPLTDLYWSNVWCVHVWKLSCKKTSLTGWRSIKWSELKSNKDLWRRLCAHSKVLCTEMTHLNNINNRKHTPGSVTCLITYKQEEQLSHYNIFSTWRDHIGCVFMRQKKKIINNQIRSHLIIPWLQICPPPLRW